MSSNTVQTPQPPPPPPPPPKPTAQRHAYGGSTAGPSRDALSSAWGAAGVQAGAYGGQASPSSAAALSAPGYDIYMDANAAIEPLGVSSSGVRGASEEHWVDDATRRGLGTTVDGRGLLYGRPADGLLLPRAGDAADDADPGPGWLPDVIREKSKSDLAHLLHAPDMLRSLSTSTLTTPTTGQALATTQQPVHAQLSHNADVATHLHRLTQQLQEVHAQTQTHLLKLHGLERTWRVKQSDMDRALEPFSPMALYQRLVAAVAEQDDVCQALELSFLEGGHYVHSHHSHHHHNPSLSLPLPLPPRSHSHSHSHSHLHLDARSRGGGGTGREAPAPASAGGGGGGGGGGGATGVGPALGNDADIADFVRAYRRAKETWYLRREQKERWDEGRVGGWR